MTAHEHDDDQPIPNTGVTSDEAVASAERLGEAVRATVSYGAATGRVRPAPHPDGTTEVTGL